MAAVGQPLKVFFDANVLFSAACEGSNLRQLSMRVVADHFGITSDFALAEARKNIELKRPRWSDGFKTLERELHAVVPSVVFDLPVPLVEKDRPILCSASASKCDVLVTGDRRHFSHLFGETIEGVTVLSVAQLAERIFRR